MQNVKRLTIAELKAKAETTNVVENMEAIQGAGLFNCHGWWGRAGKYIADKAEDIAIAVVLPLRSKKLQSKFFQIIMPLHHFKKMVRRLFLFPN